MSRANPAAERAGQVMGEHGLPSPGYEQFPRQPCSSQPLLSTGSVGTQGLRRGAGREGSASGDSELFSPFSDSMGEGAKTLIRKTSH